MSKKYNNPPIREALCEFQFIPSQPWDMTIPGLFYEKIVNDFPTKQQQVGLELGFQPRAGSIEQKIEMSQRIQFLRSDKSALVQIGPDLLIVNNLKPYPTWAVFKPMILNNLNTYQDIAKPKGFKRIGLRYINIFLFDEEVIEESEYFRYYALVPQELPQIHEALSIRIETPYENRRDRLLLTLATVPSEKPNKSSLLLDLDYIMSIPESIQLEHAPDWIENAHTTVENAFEACITDKCRSLFEKEK